MLTYFASTPSTTLIVETANTFFAWEGISLILKIIFGLFLSFVILAILLKILTKPNH